MRKSDHALAVAIIASAAMHVAILLTMTAAYVQDVDQFIKNRYTYPKRLTDLLCFLPIGQLEVHLPGPAPAAMAIPPDPGIRFVPQPAEPAVAQRPKDELDRFLLSRFGEADGKGTASQASPGDDPVEGHKFTQNQPWLSRDPVGPALNPPEPSPFTGLPGQNGNGGRIGLPGPGGSGQPRSDSTMAAVRMPEFVDPPNVPFGAPAPPLPVQPKLNARPPVRDIIADAPPKPDRIIGIAKPIPDALPSVVEGKSDKPNLLLVDAATTRPTNLPPIVVRQKPNDPNPEQPTLDPSKVTPPNMPKQLAVMDTLKAPTTQAVADFIPNASEDGIGNIAVHGPTTRPADGIAMRFPEEPMANATIGTDKEARPTTLPVGENPLIKGDFNPEKKRNEKPADPKPEIPQVAAANAQSTANPNPGPGGDPNAGSGRPGAPVTPADPAPQTDSESDPFTTVASVRIHAGKIDAQLGRKSKTIRPRLPLKAEMDLISMGQTAVTLRVSIDATGKVTDVKVNQTSGSNEIDLPVVVAVYKWWIEPPKDKAGNPKSDVMMLKICFE